LRERGVRVRGQLALEAGAPSPDGLAGAARPLLARPAPRAAARAHGGMRPQEAYQRAVKWYRAAGDLPVALHKMGWLTARGAPGVPRDAAAARALLARACALDPSMYLPSDAEIDEVGAARRGAAPGAAVLALGAAAAAAALVVLFALARTRR
jgi:hypothetical protein